jgi:hypothetical protein
MSIRRTVNAVKTIIDRSKDKRPTSGVVYGIDGRRVDLRLDNSSAIIRHVSVVGDINTVSVGDAVEIQWGSDGRPVVVIADADAFVPVADNQTIENTDDGLRVKSGGLQRHHIGFVLPDESSFIDLFSQAGWAIDPVTGIISSSGVSISPHGAISIGEGNNIIKMASYGIPDNPNSPEDDTEYRMWAGHTYPHAAGFALTKYGDLIARKGTIGGWTIASDSLYSDIGNARLHAGARPYIGLGAEEYGQSGFWAGKDTDYEYKVSIGSAGGPLFTYDGTDITLQDIDLKMYNGTQLTLWIQDDGDFAIGSDIDTVTGSSMRIFSTDQTYNAEAFTAGDILIGNHDGAHMLWNESVGQLQFRDGAVTDKPVEVYIDTDGTLTAGYTTLSSGGIAIEGHFSTIALEGFGFPLGSSYKIQDEGDTYSAMWGDHSFGWNYGAWYVVADNDYAPPTMLLRAINNSWTGTPGASVEIGAYEFVSPPFTYTSSGIVINSEAAGAGAYAGAIIISAASDLFLIGDSVKISSWLELAELGTGDLPVTGEPGTGYGAIYAKADGKAYFKNDSGTEYDLTDSAVVKHSLADAENDFLVASGADTFVKKTLAETGAILEADIDHGNIQGLADDDHSKYPLVTNFEVDRATIATNWTDLTDGGETTLHSHAGGGGADILEVQVFM